MKTKRLQWIAGLASENNNNSIIFAFDFKLKIERSKNQKNETYQSKRLTTKQSHPK